ISGVFGGSSKHACCVVFFSTVVSSTFGLDVTISQSTYEVARGDEVTITCNFQPKNQVNEVILITWTAEPDGSFDDEEITFGTYYSLNNHVDIDSKYEGKAQIISDVGAKTSQLVLKQVTVRESRLIRCRVQIPGDASGQTSDTTSLVVLVAPSQPVCKIKGITEYGYNISLTCVSDEGSPAPTYKWQSYDASNVPRSFPPKTTEKDGVLSLFNVSMDTSGYYICTASNKIRSASCNLTLSVMPSTFKISATAGIIGGCVAGIAVLVLIIYCCCRKKEKEEDYANEPPVLEYHDASEKEEREEFPLDLRKASFEGGIDQREKNQLKVEIISNVHGSEDGDRNSNRRFTSNEYQDRTADRREDDQRDRDEDRRDNYNKGRYDDRQDRFDDRRDRYDDRQDRYEDRRYNHDDRRDRYNDRQGGYDDRRDRSDDRYDDRRDRSDDRRDRSDDRRDRSDDRYDDRYDDRRDRYDDRRDRYDDRYDDRRDRYDDRQGRYDDRRDR
ncbi:hypothetical protein NFI96_033403, partial [Prochilodus magdalenae]